MKRKALFLDRDGTLNVERKDYVRTPEELEWIEENLEPLQMIQKEGWLLVLITNQSGVGRGVMTEKDLDQVHSKLRADLAVRGIRVDAVYYCPHKPEDGCDCRKPRPGLLQRALRDLEIDPHTSWMIGDSDSDVAAAKALGIRAIKIGPDFPMSRAVHEIMAKGFW